MIGKQRKEEEEAVTLHDFLIPTNPISHWKRRFKGTDKVVNRPPRLQRYYCSISGALAVMDILTS
jgi:hypothetical protein